MVGKQVDKAFQFCTGTDDYYAAGNIVREGISGIFHLLKYVYGNLAGTGTDAAVHFSGIAVKVAFAEIGLLVHGIAECAFEFFGSFLGDIVEHHDIAGDVA